MQHKTCSKHYCDKLKKKKFFLYLLDGAMLFTHDLLQYNLCLQIGIIGGSGLDNIDILENRKEKAVTTVFGKVFLLFVLFIL